MLKNSDKYILWAIAVAAFGCIFRSMYCVYSDIEYNIPWFCMAIILFIVLGFAHKRFMDVAIVRQAEYLRVHVVELCGSKFLDFRCKKKSHNMGLHAADTSEGVIYWRSDGSALASRRVNG